MAPNYGTLNSSLHWTAAVVKAGIMLTPDYWNLKVNNSGLTCWSQMCAVLFDGETLPQQSHAPWCSRAGNGLLKAQSCCVIHRQHWEPIKGFADVRIRGFLFCYVALHDHITKSHPCETSASVFPTLSCIFHKAWNIPGLRRAWMDKEKLWQEVH